MYAYVTSRPDLYQARQNKGNNEQDASGAILFMYYYSTASNAQYAMTKQHYNIID